MNTYDTILLSLCKIAKYVSLPHAGKYFLFLFVRRRDIIINSHLLFSNVKVKLHLRDFIEYWIFMDGAYEKEWVALLRKESKNKVIFDIGAYIGDYSLSLCDLAKHIYAFEPAKENVLRFKKIISQNKIENITVVERVVSDTSNKNVKLYLYPEQQGWHSVFAKEQKKFEKVFTVSVDDYVKREKIKKVDIIKIDVEGAEADVLKGAENVLKRDRPILLVEINNALITKFGKKIDDILEVMRKAHYSSYILQNGELKRVSIAYIRSIYYENILFLYSTKE